MEQYSEIQMTGARAFAELAKMEADRHGWQREAQQVIDTVMRQMQPHVANEAAATYAKAFDQDDISDWDSDEVRSRIADAFKAGHDNATKSGSVRSLNNAYAR